MWTIRLTSQLPTLIDTGTVISGTSQTANQGDTNSSGPEIQLLSTGTCTTHDLILESSGNVVHGLAINGFWGDGVIVSVPLTTVPALPNLTATGTDDAGNTSAFSIPLPTGCWHIRLPLVVKGYSTP